ncbi:22722_t:CDS:2, partial [Racocetra persica]
TRHKKNINNINNLIRNNKHIKTLYKEYQTERSATRDLVRQNTIKECKELDLSKVRTFQEDMMDIDMNQDETLDEILDESNDRLTLNQAIEILSIAEKQMTDEIKIMEVERNELFQDIQRYFVIHNECLWDIFELGQKDFLKPILSKI